MLVELVARGEVLVRVGEEQLQGTAFHEPLVMVALSPPTSAVTSGATVTGTQEAGAG